jgi:hypothetical protein
VDAPGVAASQAQFADGFAEQGNRRTLRQLKHDWYDLDQKYVRDHPDSLFWRVLMVTPNPPSVLPFVPEAAMHPSLDHIRSFYSQPDPDRVLDRPYPFLNERTMARYVDETADDVRKILSLLDAQPNLNGLTSAVMLLPEDTLRPYPPPLGDTPPAIHE